MNKIFSLLKSRYFKFGVALTIYILWVIWMGNYWFLLGIPVVFDVYISKKVNWSPWKKRNKKNHPVIEWLDAIIFAIVAVTIINIFLFQNYKIPTSSMDRTLMIGDHLYVSKVSYGPRTPITPLSLPFVHNIIFGSTPSFLTWLQWPYKRLAGFGHIKRDDIVVFNYPAGDTVSLDMPDNQSYYSYISDETEKMKQEDLLSGIKRSESEYYSIIRKQIMDKQKVVFRPLDKMDPYVKRCVAIAGDTLLVKNGEVFINGVLQREIDGKQFIYRVRTKSPINPKIIDDMGIPESDIMVTNDGYYLNLTKENYTRLKSLSNVISIEDNFYTAGEADRQVFPNSAKFNWNVDNYGPLYIPKKDAVVKLTLDNLPLYKRIIASYEKNSLVVRDSVIYINGNAANEYKFKMDYYFMMGDNRHQSLDSRYWGFVPEDHIVGKPIFIWLSLDANKGFLQKVRWSRFFRKAQQ